MGFSVLDWTFGIGISVAVIAAGASEWVSPNHPSTTFEKSCKNNGIEREMMSSFSTEEAKAHCECITEHIKEDAQAVNYTSLINWMSSDSPEEYMDLDTEFSVQSLKMFGAAYEQCTALQLPMDTKPQDS